jgi:ribosome-associated protein
MAIDIGNGVTVPDDELRFTYSRSGGPGGQNVNKVNSKATLHWDVLRSPSLPEDVRQRFLASYGQRVSRQGMLVLSSQRFRDQSRNVDDCLEKLAGMLRGALHPRKRRRPTRPTRGSRERRLRAKRHLSAKKGLRRDGRAGDAS